MPFDAFSGLETSSVVPDRVSRWVRVIRRAWDVRTTTITALANGGCILPDELARTDVCQRARWNVACKCEAPTGVLQIGEGHYRLDLANGSLVWEPMRELEMFVPCRKCTPCLRARSYRWGARSVTEFLRACVRGDRTWFGTLTFRPEDRYRLQAATEARLLAGGSRLADLEEPKQFAERHRETGREVTLFLKRLRKGLKTRDFPAVKFKYFLAVEPHKDGTPHYHILITEVVGSPAISKRALDWAWTAGICQWRLVKDDKQVRYASKYLNKGAHARVRASRLYGVDDTVSTITKCVVRPPTPFSPSIHQSEARAKPHGGLEGDGD